MNFILENEYHIAVPTAFCKDEELNIQATLEHIIYLQNVGIKSALVCGSTGEQHSLTYQEKISLVEAIENENRLDDDFEIIFGIASIRQKEAVLLAEVINRTTKISGILLGFSPYILPSQEEAVEYVKAIVAVCEKPIVLYNNPKRTGFNLESDSIFKLMDVPNIVGLKEAGDENRIPDLKEQLPSDFYFYAGGESKLKEKVKLGFNRLSSISGNLYPLETEEWFRSLRKGEEQDFHLEKEVAKIFENSPLVYLKEQITSKENIQMGLPRSPLGNGKR